MYTYFIVQLYEGAWHAIKTCHHLKDIIVIQ